MADRAAEQLARSLIEARFPQDGIVGEEFGEVRPASQRRWILDPIDGTRSFVRGVPLYGVLIAVEDDGEAVVGVMHFPALQETVYAALGEGCWWNGRRALVSETSSADDALLLCTSYEGIEKEHLTAGWDSRRSRAGMVRTWGDCYGHALVATGRAEGMFDPVMSVWDAAALEAHHRRSRRRLHGLARPNHAPGWFGCLYQCGTRARVAHVAERIEVKIERPDQLDALRFDERGLIPVIAQHATSGEVLMVAYANREALERTLTTRHLWLYSRSRQLALAQG